MKHPAPVPAMDPRYLRQALLPEIGTEGQARLQHATAAVLAPRAHADGDPGPALAPPDPRALSLAEPRVLSLVHEVAERYARGAGFGTLVSGPIDLGALAPPDIVLAPEPAAVLAGARAALAAVRAALASPAPASPPLASPALASPALASPASPRETSS